MATIKRSGISVDVSDGMSVVDTIPREIDRRRGATTSLADAPVFTAQDDVLDQALQRTGNGMELIEGFTICPPPEDAARRSGTEDPRRRVTIRIPVAADNSAVILVEEDGIYRWMTGERGDADSEGVVVIDLDDGVPEGAEDADDEERRSEIRRWLMKPIRALVIRFTGFVGVKAVVAAAEFRKRSALISMASDDADEWTEIQPAHLAAQLHGGRVLLFVHGTFSTTRGSFRGLTMHPAGMEFLAHARTHYDAVIGFEHRSLSPTPEENAKDLVEFLRNIDQRMEMDVVAYSRGGMVARYLIEHELPSSDLDLKIGRCVMVGCTNGGTNLANPDRWHELADWYTTMTVGLCSVAEWFPATTVAAEAVSEILESTFAFVKHLSTAVVRDGGVPGIAAMEPISDQVTRLNVITDDHPDLEDLDYRVIESDYQAPQDSGGMKILSAAAHNIFQGPSDLVVDTESMTKVRPTALKDTFTLGRYDCVHHLGYFFDRNVAEQLQDWLGNP